MSKQNISATVDEDVAGYLSQDHVNASGLINQLVKRHMNGENEELLREFRRKQLEEEAEELASRAERKRKEAEKLAEVAEKKQLERQSELEEVAEELAGVERDPENPAVKAQAAKLGVEPEDLLAELPDRDDGGLDSL